MGSLFLTKYPFQTTVIASVVTFMLLNAFVPLNFSAQAETTKYPFKLTLTLEKTTFKLGEPVNVTWILTNIGTENVTIYYACDFISDFMVLDESGDHIFRFSRLVGDVFEPHPYPPIPPGGNLTRVETWTQIYDNFEVDFETHPWQIIRHPVPPGTYYIYGIFQSPTYKVELETPILKITITEG